MARVVRNPAFVQEWASENGPIWQQEAGTMGMAAIIAAAPVDSGLLASSGEITPIFDDSGQPAVRMALRAHYTAYVDQGTGLFGKYARKITSATGKTMTWMSGPDRIFAKSTRGQPGQRFFRRGLESVFGRVDEHRWGD